MKKLSCIGIKEDGKVFRIVNAKLLKNDLDSLPKGKYRLTVDKLKKNKSNPQLAWLYGQIYPLVLQGLLDSGWDQITNLDQVDIYCKSLFAKTEIVNKHSGEVMEIPALKRDMTTTEFATYVQAIREWASEYLNVIIPDPESNFNINFEPNE